MVKAPAFVILRLSPFTASQICERYVGHSDLSNPALECQIKLVPNQSGETCLQNRVDEGKFSGGLIRRVARGEEKGGEGLECGCTAECASLRKTHIPSTPSLLTAAREICHQANPSKQPSNHQQITIRNVSPPAANCAAQLIRC